MERAAAPKLAAMAQHPSLPRPHNTSHRSTLLRGLILSRHSLDPRLSRLLESEPAKLTRFMENKTMLRDSAWHNGISPSHPQLVHWLHIGMLRECAARGFKPCLLIEGDSLWPVGTLVSSISTVLSERRGEPWDVIILGANMGTAWCGDGQPEGGCVQTQTESCTPCGSVVFDPRVSDVRNHSFRVATTGTGCHAYLARDPGALAAAFERRMWWNRPWNGHYCVERMSSSDGLRVLLPTSSLVVQRGKEYRHSWNLDAARQEIQQDLAAAATYHPQSMWQRLIKRRVVCGGCAAGPVAGNARHGPRSSSRSDDFLGYAFEKLGLIVRRQKVVRKQLSSA